ncbi:MAG: phosphoribosyl-ATP diphosphatase [Rhizobiaceae bacterium]|nr:phosphoribosyl-ATP diphosphatase [Rhizobiaceae bacterium]
MTDFTLDTLNEIIASRSEEATEKSYTASLLAKGSEKCAKKFGEESVEAVIAAVSGDKTELTKEAADVFYHLLVMLKSEGVELASVMAELENRTTQSGHQEKASRKG